MYAVTYVGMVTLRPSCLNLGNVTSILIRFLGWDNGSLLLDSSPRCFPCIHCIPLNQQML